MTNTAHSTGSLPQLMRRHPLIFYFVLAYLLSWLVSLPSVLAEWKVINGDYTFPLVLKQWIGPGLAGLIMSRIVGDKAALSRRVRLWQVSWLWYILVLVGTPLLIFLGIVIQPDLMTNYQGSVLTVLNKYPVTFLIVLIGIGVPEEIGWRGFALPRLQQRHGPLLGSLILGVLWACWHLFFFLLPDHGGGPGANLVSVAINFFIFSMMVIALAIVYTWVFNHTRGSVWIASLLHAAMDTPQLVWLPLILSVGMSNSIAGERSLDLALLIPFSILAVLIVILTRGKLGYKPENVT